MVRTHSPGLLRQLLERVRGREQMLIRGFPEQPLLLVSYPRDGRMAAELLRGAWLHTLPLLASAAAQAYRGMLAGLPGMIVVILRRRNVCTCLGHHHPPGAETRLARRLSSDVGIAVGEIDLAWEAIREWQPQPLSALAAHVEGDGYGALRFRISLLTVLLHELEHIAYPDRNERAVRHSSDEFYSESLNELLRAEGVGQYGLPERQQLP